MLFLKADGTNLARVDAPKPSFWSSISNISKTTKVAIGVFATGAAVAASAISFGAIPLIAGSAIALAGVGIYAYGKISQAIERRSYVKPILKAPPKDFDYMYVAPQNRGGNAAPLAVVASPVAAAPKQGAAAPKVAVAPKQVPAPAVVKKAVPASAGKENENKSSVSMIFPNRIISLGQKVSSQAAPKMSSVKPLANSSRQQILA